MTRSTGEEQIHEPAHTISQREQTLSEIKPSTDHKDGYFPKTIRPYAKLVITAVGGFVATCMVLDILGKTYPVFYVTTWGTYAQWASALLPSLIAMLTVHMWLMDRRDKIAESVEKRLAPLRNIQFEMRPDVNQYALWLTNRTGMSVDIVAINGAPLTPSINIPDGGERSLPNGALSDSILTLRDGQIYEVSRNSVRTLGANGTL